MEYIAYLQKFNDYAVFVLPEEQYANVAKLSERFYLELYPMLGELIGKAYEDWIASDSSNNTAKDCADYIVQHLASKGVEIKFKCLVWNKFYVITRK